MRLSRKILVLASLFSFLGFAPLRADEPEIFIDPSDPKLIRRTEIPFASEVLLRAGDLPPESPSHPKIAFGEQKFSHLKLSPDGLWVAFSVDGESSDWSGIFDIATRKVREVSLSFDAEALAPYWSADGGKLAIENRESNGRMAIRVYQVESGRLCVLDGRDAKNKYLDLLKPWWSEDGEKLYFQVRVNNDYRRTMGLKPLAAATRIGEAGAACQNLVLRSVERFMAEVPSKSLPTEAMAFSPQGSL